MGGATRFQAVYGKGKNDLDTDFDPDSDFDLDKEPVNCDIDPPAEPACPCCDTGVMTLVGRIRCVPRSTFQKRSEQSWQSVGAGA